MKKLKWLFPFPLILIILFLIYPVRHSAFELLLDVILKNSVTQVTPEEVDPSLFLLLDTREKEEFEISHLPGATWVGFEDFDKNRIPGNPKKKPVLLYCSMGLRSEKIGDKMLEMGFEEVKNLRGGAFRWINEGRSLVDNTGEETKDIRPFNAFWGVWLTAGNKKTKE